MFLLNILAALGGFFLLFLAMLQVQIIGSIFEHHFGLFVFGVVVFGLALGMSISSLISPWFRERNSLQTMIFSFVTAVLTAAAGFLLIYQLPLGTVPAFLIILISMSLPYLCIASGFKIVIESKEKQKIITGFTVGGIAALLIAPTSVPVLMDVLFSHSAGKTLNWTEAGIQQAKPLFAELERAELEGQPLTKWSASGRTDILTYKNEAKDFRWVFSNGVAPVPEVKLDNVGHSKQWWNTNFPLIALPILQGQPQHYLSIGPVSGPELLLAKRFAVPDVRGLAYNTGYSAAQESVPAIRSLLQLDSKKHDQIFIPILHLPRGNWFNSNLEDSYLYTEEAFRSYWEHLSPNGMLVVTAADMRLLLKALFIAWRVSDDDLRSQTWGLRLSAAAPLKGTYQFAFIISKNRNSTYDFSRRLQEISGMLPVDFLFGPGIKVQRPFNILYRSEGVDKARDIMTRMMAKRMQDWIDLEPATDERPFFFYILQDVRASVKWLLAGCIVGLIYCFLFSVPSLRRPDSSVPGKYPPIPMFLGYFLVHGFVMSLIAGAILWRSILPLGWAEVSSLFVYLPWLVGVAAGTLINIKRLLNNKIIVSTGVPLVVVVFLLLSYAGLTGEGLSSLSWSTSLIKAMVAVLSLFSAFTMALSMRIGLNYLSKRLPELVSWAWAVFGIAALAGSVLSFWIAKDWTWMGVWTVAIAGYLFVFAIGFWLWRAGIDNTEIVIVESNMIAGSN